MTSLLKAVRPFNLVLSLLVAVVASAQEQPTSTDRAPLITTVYFPVGFFAGGSPLLTTTDWRNLMPTSELLQRDLSWDTGSQSTFSTYRNGPEEWESMANGGPVLEVSLGLDMGRKKGAEARFDKELRVGVSYLANGFLGRTWDRSATGRYDTLTSSLNGQQSYVDTTWREEYSAEYRFTRIGLNASYLVRKRSANKLTWYAGFGAMLGTTLNASASVQRIVNTTTSRSFSDYPELDSSFEADEYEEVHVASTAWGAGYALAGLDLRLGTKSPFWSSIHLFNELRPTLLFSKVPGSSTATTGAFQNVFGMRLDLR
ncbi:MAG: hypothetical protein IPF95_05130 [Flavobacteriales bacterium]|nr:hypothetical protein [Flavobacteriales bacterium]MBK6944191.1 hypothetical protein [Flavobacteriales bacterium]MBK9533858.1 hypothetical protein [Flavobacteriales bacterium]MBP9137143.1 hypothetical protein [Flavobacteriales bacterium]HQV51092.1 hypothetical protein [Flavobacteriales bacterium]